MMQDVTARGLRVEYFFGRLRSKMDDIEEGLRWT